MIGHSLPAPRIVLLAAGFSRRLGSPKALTRVRGLSLLEHALAVLTPLAGSRKIVVVIPPRATRYRLGRQANDAVFVPNPERRAGLSSSVRRGVRYARYSSAVLLLPVDLVHLKRRDIAHLLGRWRGARRKVVARRIDGNPGTPLILPRWLYAHAMALTGDQGLRDWVRRLPMDVVTLVDIPSAEIDVDTPRDLVRARRAGRR